MPKQKIKRVNKLTFKKGIHTLNFPFLLDNLSPWQDQTFKWLERIKGKYKVRKSARWGFSINENIAEIKCYKN